MRDRFAAGLPDGTNQRQSLTGFAFDLQYSPGQELKTALEETGKIAYERLQDIIHPTA
jgi:2-oxo-4-hydroxy-4-carboxy--5-ureidoimidazoline (OHCU) decarboxylase